MCSTYSWTIDYVATLNSRQVRLILDGRQEYNEFLQSIKDDKDSPKSFSSTKFSTKNVHGKMKKPNLSNISHEPELPSWNTKEDMMGSGLFNVIEKKHKKKRKK